MRWSLFPGAAIFFFIASASAFLSFGDTNSWRPLIAAAIGAAGLFTLLPLSVALAAVLLAVAFGGAVVWWARVRLGGQTGDVLGAVQQVIEIAVYGAAAAGSSAFYA